jgi:hypothetical protein
MERNTGDRMPMTQPAMAEEASNSRNENLSVNGLYRQWEPQSG